MLSVRQRMNEMGQRCEPFLFIIDFDAASPIIVPLSEVPDTIWYDVNGVSNVAAADAQGHSARPVVPEFEFRARPISYERYLRAFEYVHRHFVYGNTFLLNLTFPTPIETTLTLPEIFLHSRAPYRLLVRNHFVVFSPECFVRIRSGRISSFPMKGTIDASIPDARERILADEKETAEHVTIVDLIRNDLGMVARSIGVPRFRYIDRIETSEKTLLQVSSEVTGILPEDYQSHIGDILMSLLPAGSITGAPKKKTVEIIKAAEGYDRGYYTGVFGYFDGHNLDSAVMIRYIEQSDGLCFKSGGGLTIYADPTLEYQELVDKVYVPIPRNHPIPARIVPQPVPS